MTKSRKNTVPVVTLVTSFDDKTELYTVEGRRITLTGIQGFRTTSDSLPDALSMAMAQCDAYDTVELTTDAETINSMLYHVFN